MEGIKRVYDNINRSISKFGVKVKTPEFDFSKALSERVDSNNSGNEEKEKKDINQIIKEAAFKNNLSEDLIKAVIKTESSFKPDAVSPKGAQGLMQLMPQTAMELGVSDPFDEEENVMGGSKYLSDLINKYQDVRLGLAAYNAGPGNVDRYGGIPPFPETQNYVADIMNILGREG